MRTEYWVGLIVIVVALIYLLWSRRKFYVINFTVKSESSPVVGADVWLEKAGEYSRHLVTDFNGFIGFGNVSTGTHSYRVAADGYYEDTGTLWISSNMVVSIELVKDILPPPPPGPGRVLTTNVWYLYHYNDDYDPDWRTNVGAWLERGLNKFEGYTASGLPLSMGGEFRSSYPIGHGGNLGDLATDAAVRGARNELAQDLTFCDQYYEHELTILIFATMASAYVVDFKAPIIYGGGALMRDYQKNTTLTPHEIFHTFKLDHCQDQSCIMCNANLQTVNLCSRHRAEFDWNNFSKKDYCGVWGIEKAIFNSMLIHYYKGGQGG